MRLSSVCIDCVYLAAPYLNSNKILKVTFTLSMSACLSVRLSVFHSFPHPPPPGSISDIRKVASRLKTLVIFIQHHGVFKQVSSIPHLTNYSILWRFVFPASGFDLYATCLKESVFCFGFHFSVTNRRILSQLHDVFLKYLIKICAVPYAILWNSTAYCSQNNMD
jgi:hypothetical protein